VDRLVKEAIEIYLNKNNFNRDGGFILSQAWSPITNMLMNVRGGPSRHLAPPTNPLVSPPVIISFIYHDADGLKVILYFSNGSTAPWGPRPPHF
jgi:hypothetical protein